MILAVVVFLVAAGADVLWAKYTMYAADRRAVLAAVWAALIIPAGAVSVIAYTDNRWYLIPSVLGAFVGTFVAVKRHKVDAVEAETEDLFRAVSEHWRWDHEKQEWIRYDGAR